MPPRSERSGTGRPTREQVVAACGRTIPDILAPQLGVLFVGINPSLYSAAVGHHFARPGNRFWPALFAAGLTDRLLTPAEDGLLPHYGFGVTNVVARATASADELDAAEMVQGARLLEAKVRRIAPTAVAILGVGAYRTGWNRPKAVVGRQEERLAGAEIWVLPNPSGLNAHYQLADLARVYRELHHVAIRSETGINR